MTIEMGKIPLQLDLPGKLFIISGPSGVGKGTVIKALKERFPNFIFPISHTTRPKRDGEREGEVYHYIDRETFQKGIDGGEFLEWAQIHKSHYYGTLKKPIMDALEEGKIVVREVDVQGAQSIKELIPAPHLVTIFLKAESLDDLIKRIQKRGKLPEDEIARRMESAQKELALASSFDYQVWSLENRVEECVENVVAIIEKECAQVGLKI